MSTENVKKFYEAVSQDEALKLKFTVLAQKFQGQQMDEAKGMAILEQETLPLAAQMGYSFTLDDLNAYGEEMKHAKKNCELSDTELEAVTGGVSFACFIIGAGQQGGACVGFGVDSQGQPTCIGLGITTI